MKRNFIIFLCLLIIISLKATILIAETEGDPGAALPPGVIKGTVHDSTSQGSIEYATVGLYRIKDSTLVSGVVTTADGGFILKNVPAGEYYLDASFIGYARKRIAPVILSSAKNSLDLGIVALHPDITKIGEVQVVAQNPRLEYKIDKKVVNVAQDITSAGGTLVNVLENTPSVDVDVEGNVTLRGSSNFQLLIDGKPSPIKGSEGLQQIPASAVQSLEIITSPSAKYDPDGNAGIINVIMKKEKTAGVNGVVNASVGTRQKYTADFLLNIKRQKFNYFIGGEYSDQNFYNTGKSIRRTYAGDTTTSILTGSKGTFNRYNYDVKSGFEYALGDKSSVSFSGTMGNRDFIRNFRSNSKWFTKPASIDSFYTEDDHSKDNNVFYDLSLIYNKTYDKPEHKLQASVYYTGSKGNETEEDVVRGTNDLYQPIGSQPTLTRSRIEGPDKNLRIELDYSKPIGAGKLEAGLQSRWDKDNFDYIYEDFHPLGSEWIRNDTISNSLKYLDALQSVYLIYSMPAGKFNFQAGLRSEYDNRQLEQKTTSEKYSYEKLHLFPSFYVTRKFSDAHQLQFTYSRRIERPDERDLNPFKEYRGVNNVFYGNPGLKPEFTNAFELNYQYTFKKGFVSLETYDRATNNVITRVNGLDTLAGRPVYTFTPINADRDNSLGIELMANLDLTKWWQVNVTGNVFHYQLNGHVQDQNIKTTSNTWRTNFSSTFKMKWDTRLQITGVYNGPSVTLQGQRDGFFVANAALRKDLFKKQFTIAFNVRDIFSTGFYAFTSSGSDFYTWNKFRRESPVVTINLSYRINNYRQQGNRRANEGGNENGGGIDEML